MDIQKNIQKITLELDRKEKRRFWVALETELLDAFDRAAARAKKVPLKDKTAAQVRELMRSGKA